MGAEELDCPAAAAAEPAVDVDVPVLRDLGEAIGDLAQGNQHSTGDAELLVLPGFAYVDERGSVAHGVAGLLWGGVNVLGHAPEYTFRVPPALLGSTQ